MKIFIDADACPVVHETESLAKKYKIDCIAFCDTSHILSLSYAKTITVSKGSDSVDFALVNQIQSEDIVVTQDYGLAAMCLSKHAHVIRQDGLIYTDDNIEGLLQIRYTEGKIRRSGGRTKNHPKRTQSDNRKYEESLEKLIIFCKNN